MLDDSVATRDYILDYFYFIKKDSYPCNGVYLNKYLSLAKSNASGREVICMKIQQLKSAPELLKLKNDNLSK